MKEFEKWWLKFEPQIDPDTYNGNEKEIRKAVARCTYRAALGWVLGQHCHGDWDDGSALETAIKQELRENDKRRNNE